MNKDCILTWPSHCDCIYRYLLKFVFFTVLYPPHIIFPKNDDKYRNVVRK